MIQLPDRIPIDPKWIAAAGGIEALERFYIPIQHDEKNRATVRIKLSRREKRILRKKKLIQPSIWVEKHLVLPRDAAIEGPWRNRNVPYLPGIMDASFFTSVQEITVCAAPQCAKTQGIFACLGYAADRKPGNIMVVFPNEKESGEANRDRLQQMFRDSRRLRTYLTGYVDDESSLRFRLQHLILYMAWANSPSRLASKPLPYVFLDEVDKFPETASKKEAGPIDLARKRTRTFGHMRKIWKTSSPTIEEGPIWKEMQESQVLFDYFVRCPDCGAVQKMIFDQIKWEGRSKADPNQIEAENLAWYECEKCQSIWDDEKRNQAVRSGEWRDREHGRSLMTALKSLKPIRIGFHIPAWLSPFVTLSECAAAFIRGLKDKTKMKDFYNGFAAEPWMENFAERKVDVILKLKDDRPWGRVPGGGVVAGMTAGVDTQDYSLVYEIRAWGYGMEKESWGIRAGEVPTFEALAKVLWEDEYYDPEGNRYVVSLALQDALGHRTSEVYDFCVFHRGFIFPCFGKQKMAQPYTRTNLEFFPGSKKPIPGGLIGYNLNTQFYKDTLSRMLEISPADPGAWHYNSELTEAWAKQMTVEVRDEKDFWINPKKLPNHAWDVSYLNLAAHDLLGIRTWPKPEPLEKKPAAQPKSQQQTGGRSRPGWFNRR